MSAITISNINKSFGAQQVLKDINLDIQSGEFIVLLGSSGCGKSTLLNVIAGLEEINDGAVSIGNVDVTGHEPSKRGIAMVFQSYALYPTMTVRRNMSFGLQVKSVPKPEIERRVAWAAEMLQIDNLLDRKPGQLSGGQRQRVAIGRALVQESKVFLFDEPLSNLDAKLRTEMRIEIKRLHKYFKSTIVYVTHDQIEAMTLATRIAVMRAGRVEQYATPDTLYEKPETLFVAGFVGSPAMNFLPAVIKRDGNGSVKAQFSGSALPLNAYPFKTAVGDGEAIVLGVRPEHISLADSGTNGVVIEADTLFLEPMGADTLGWFDFAGQRIAARIQPHRAKTVSGRVRLLLDLAHASVFSKTSEQRL
jgi:multiple sugar transport system ATP-binding protein